MKQIVTSLIAAMVIAAMAGVSFHWLFTEKPPIVKVGSVWMDNPPYVPPTISRAAMAQRKLYSWKALSVKKGIVKSVVVTESDLEGAVSYQDVISFTCSRHKIVGEK